jgi:hypothetical protein
MSLRNAFTIWVAASAAVVVVGVFGTWARVGSSGVPGTDNGNHGWIVLVAALLAAGVFWFRRDTRSAGLYVALLGAVAVAAVAYDRTHLADAIGGGKLVAASARAGWGLDLAFAGSVSLVLAGAAWVLTVTDLPWRWLAPAPGGAALRPTAVELAAHDDIEL